MGPWCERRHVAWRHVAGAPVGGDGQARAELGMKQKEQEVVVEETGALHGRRGPVGGHRWDPLNQGG